MDSPDGTRVFSLMSRELVIIISWSWVLSELAPRLLASSYYSSSTPRLRASFLVLIVLILIRYRWSNPSTSASLPEALQSAECRLQCRETAPASARAPQRGYFVTGTFLPPCNPVSFLKSSTTNIPSAQAPARLRDSALCWMFLSLVFTRFLEHLKTPIDSALSTKCLPSPCH